MKTRSQYLPEPVFFEETAEFPVVASARLTARQVAGWASHYAVGPVRLPGPTCRGRLPDDPSDRLAFIDSLFDQLERPVEHEGMTIVPGAGLVLSEAGAVLLDQHDGPPGALFLTPEEFAALQRTWRDGGLPEDLYFPAREQRRAVEPVERFGGRVLDEVVYSPLQWARRQATITTLSPLPTEAERREAFLAAIGTFVRAASRRKLELLEPGKGRDQPEIGVVDSLLLHVTDALSELVRLYAVGRDHG